MGVLIGGGFGIFAIINKSTPSPQNTWNAFISCINNSKYNDTIDYVYYLNDEQEENYNSYTASYALYSNLSTSSFKQLESDRNYSICEVVLNGTMIVSGIQTNPVYKYNVYFVKSADGEWKLLSPLNITLGNNNSYQIDKTNQLIYSNLYAYKTAVFYYGDNFESIHLPNDIVSISGTFYAHLTSLNSNNVCNCPTSLLSLEIPNTISNIENRAFSNFTNITTLYLPKNLRSIGDYAFYNSNSLVNLYYEGNGLNIGNNALPNSLTFSISYDLDGGVNNTDNPYTFSANTPTFILKEPTRSGYTFIGWTSTTQVTPIKEYKIKKNSIGNKSVKANWATTTYTITYNLDGGINATVNPDGFTIESGSFELAEPTKVGYTFTGWTYESVSSPKKTVVVDIIGNKEYTANWSANEYVVTYDADGGSLSKTSQTVYYDESVTHPIPAKDDYAFNGWYCNGEKYSDGVWKTASNITLTAYWTKNPTYTVNHYQQNIDDKNYTLFETERFLGVAGTAITPSVKTYSGFNSPKTQTTTISADGTRTINYYYTRMTYSLTIIKNDGTSETKGIKYKANIENTITISRDGFTFGGYFTNEKLSERVITMPSGNTTIYAWWKEETKPCYLEYEGTSSITIKGYTRTGTKLQIPNYIGNRLVTKIDSSAFKNRTILSEIVIPDSVTSIGENAFSGCTKLTSITIPFVGGSETSDTRLEHIFGSVPTSLKTVKITRATSIGSYAFRGCSGLTEIVIPDSVTSIGSDAFYGCAKLTSIAVPDSVTSIGSYAFDGCSGLTSIAIPDSVTSIGSSAFRGCSGLTSITIPNSVTSIGSYAFSGCSGLTSITIPEGVTSIGSSTFYYCSSLTEITLPFVGATLDGTSNTHFGYIFGAYSYSSNSSYVPESLKTVVITGVTSIGSSAFRGCSGLTSIVIPSSVTSIGFYAFYDCDSLTKVYYKGGIDEWERISRDHNDGLTYVTKYYYSKEQPSSTGNYWHYVDGVVTEWKKEE